MWYIGCIKEILNILSTIVNLKMKGIYQKYQIAITVLQAINGQDVFRLFLNWTDLVSRQKRS